MKQGNRIALSNEECWVLGLVLMAFGVSFVGLSSFGYSMIVAPTFCVFIKVGGLLSFGTAEYLMQAMILLLLCVLLQRFQLRYLLSFGTAVIYGYLFDFARFCTGDLPTGALWLRTLYFVGGSLLIAFSVAFFFRTYLPTEVYELFVKEMAAKTGLPVHRMKWIYDGGSLLLALILSVSFFGFGLFEHFSFPALGQALLEGNIFEGIGIGTIIAAAVNGPLIGAAGRLLDRFFTYPVRFSFLEQKLR